MGHRSPPYMRDRALPDDDKEVERVARQAKLYVLIDRNIYRRREYGVKLLYIPEEEV